MLYCSKLANTVTQDNTMFLGAYLMSILEPKPASTVVLCRKNTRWPCEILLIKRSAAAHFLPNAHVFPGGQLEPSDYTQATWFMQDQANINRISNYFLCERELIAAHLAAAARETLEETGISILLSTPDQRPVLDNIWPLSWWVTPPGENRRYDTWFFLATVEESEISLKDQEHSEPLWLSPAHALEFHEENSIFLAPPTRSILERMAHTSSFEELVQLIDRPLKPIHPRFVDYNNQKLLVLPGHELHEDPEKSRFIMKTSYVFKLI
jgi:8-oxo-dGTP pyrophosphatase MutT (NUDIX family)